MEFYDYLSSSTMGLGYVRSPSNMFIFFEGLGGCIFLVKDVLTLWLLFKVLFLKDNGGDRV